MTGDEQVVVFLGEREFPRGPADDAGFPVCLNCNAPRIGIEDNGSWRTRGGLLSC